MPWKIYNLSSGLHLKTCKIHQSQLNLDSLCARVSAAEWNETKGRWCMVCTDTHTHLCYCLKHNWPTNTHTHTNTVKPFRGVCCGEMTGADACVLWFGEDPSLVWLQTALLAVDSSSIRMPLQWTATHERNLTERCPATFQLGHNRKDHLFIKKKSRHGVLHWGVTWRCDVYLLHSCFMYRDESTS